MSYTIDAVRDAFALACPGTRVHDVTPLDLGHASRQWLFDTDEGPLMLKIPVRDGDPDKLRNLIAATRAAAELDIPVSRFRAFLPDAAPVAAPVLVQEFLPGRQASGDWKELPLDTRQDAAATLGRWVGLLHTRRGTGFTDLLGGNRYDSVAEHVAESLAEAVTAIRVAELPVDVDTAVTRIEQGVAEFGEVVPTLCHHDFYLDNVLLADGRPCRLLDFEHARYSDQFAEFGKLSELLFDWHPETREPFLAAYQEFHQLDEHRVDVHCGLYNLVMCGYFSKWTPKLVPAYLDRIEAWLAKG